MCVEKSKREDGKVDMIDFEERKRYKIGEVELSILRYTKYKAFYKYKKTTICISEKEYNLRGILFKEEENGGIDLLNPYLSYPIVLEEPIDDKPHLEIYETISLESLLNYLKIEEPSITDLRNLESTILKNRKWLKENKILFGEEITRLLFFKIIIKRKTEAILPEMLYTDRRSSKNQIWVCCV